MNRIKTLHNARDFVESQEGYRCLVENAYDAMFRLNGNGEILFANTKFCSQVGIDNSAVIGSSFSAFLNQDSAAKLWILSFDVLLETKSPQVFSIVMQLSNGKQSTFECNLKPILNASGNLKYIIGILRDISVFMQMEKEIEELSFHDTLTKLPNHRFFFRKLDQICKVYTGVEGKIAVLFFDLDNFKKINDSFGHTLGDAVLKEFVAKIQSNMPSSGFAARLSSNRFAMFIEHSEMELQLESCITNIQKAAAQLIINQEMKVLVTVSLGIAIFPDHGQTPDNMLKHADLALNQAKASGKNTYRIYDTQMSEMVDLQVELEQSLKRALTENEFELYYQPQQDFTTNSVRGVEALLRWNHPTKGFISPADFIPIAEQTGFIIELGEWVLRTACQFIVRMQKSGFVQLKVAVNISAMQLARYDFVEMVLRCMNDTGASTDMLELEITETMLIGSLETSIEPLLILKEKGIHIALDDFGTGYSSLNYLRKLPLNHLKIDKSFLQNVVGNPEEQEFLNSIVNLVHKLNLTVTAEGAETEEQSAFVKQVGCNYLQGYYFCKPVKEEDAILFLEQKRVQ